MKKLHSATLYALFGVAYLFVSKTILFFFPELVFGRIVPTIHMGLMIMSLLSIAQYFWTLFRSDLLKGHGLLLSVTLPAAAINLAQLLSRFGFIISGEPARYLPLLQGLFWLAFFAAAYREKENPFFQSLKQAALPAMAGAAVGIVNSVPGMKLFADFSLPGFIALFAASAAPFYFLWQSLKAIKPAGDEGEWDKK